MAKHLKTIEEKLRTKLSKIVVDKRLKVTKKSVKIDDKVLLNYSANKISYTNIRYYNSKKEDVIEEDFTVTIILNHETLEIFHGYIYNPPKKCKIILNLFRDENHNINSIVVGSDKNKIENNIVYVTYSLFKTFSYINDEETRDRTIRIKNRTSPFLAKDFGLDVKLKEISRNYSLLIDEAIVSGKLSYEDIVKVTNELDVGDDTEIVIRKQIDKQVEWLLDSIQTIVDEENLNKTKAQHLGKSIFNIPKKSITGPENLMETILTKYGQNIIFGVPSLLNINNYIKSGQIGVSNSQIDIILINHLSDIEIVELKRSDIPLLSYDSSRNKFFISKDLAMAVSQCERYISALYKENDPEYSIGGKTIREFLENEIGGTITLSICRPTSLVVMGSIQRIVAPYESLSTKVKSKVSKKDYNANADRAYRELKSSYKNVQITTYSELIDGARLRLQKTENI